MTGEYDRHGFQYVVPYGEPDPGANNHHGADARGTDAAFLERQTRRGRGLDPVQKADKLNRLGGPAPFETPPLAAPQGEEVIE